MSINQSPPLSFPTSGLDVTTRVMPSLHNGVFDFATCADLECLIERGHLFDRVFYTSMYQWPSDKKLCLQYFQQLSGHFDANNRKEYDGNMDKRSLAYWNLVNDKDEVFANLFSEAKFVFAMAMPAAQSKILYTMTSSRHPL